MTSPRPFSPWRFSRQFPSESKRGYVFCKTLTDPLYPAVHAALADTTAPLLDIGCGMGLLAFYLRERGWGAPIRCFDYDQEKITVAQHLAANYPPPPHFTCADAREGLTAHRGSVTILDILQYMQPDQQAELLRQAAACIAPGARLIIRSGLSDGAGWRSRTTRWGDWLGHATKWMRDSADHYPSSDFLRAPLEASGLHGTIKPLWGKTPFNNWLAVFQR